MFSALCAKRHFRRPPQRRSLRSFRPRLEQLEDRVLLNHAPLGPEFRGNATPFNTSQSPQVAIASDAAGDFVIAWTETGPQPGSESSATVVKARRFNRDGVAQGNDIVVDGNVQTPFDGFVTVDVAMTPDGRFIVVHDAGQGDLSTVLAHSYAADGSDRGQVEVTPSFQQEGFHAAYQPSIALDDAGNAIVAYVELPNVESEQFLQAQRLDSSGHLLGPVIDVGAGRSTLSGPAIGADGQGGFVIAWTANFEQPKGIVSDRPNFIEPTPEILFERFDAAGKALDPAPVEVAVTQNGAVASVGVARDNGDFVVSWTDLTPGDLRVLAEQFTAAGTSAAPIFQVNTDPLNQLASTSVAVDNTGDFAVAWATGPSFSESPASVFARTFNADGSPESVAFKVNQVSFDSGPVDVAVDATLHQFVVNWGARGTVDDSVPLTAARIYRLPDPPPPELPPPPPITPVPPIVPPEPVTSVSPVTPVIPVAPVIPVTPVASVTPDDTIDPAAFILAQRKDEPIRNAILPFLFVEKTDHPVQPGQVSFAPVRASELPVTSLSGSQREQRLGEISGRVFMDLNGNGIQDEGEPGLAGVRVFLDTNDNGIHDENEPAIDTDPQGRYLFTGLALSRYRVRQTLRQPRVLQTSPPQNSAHEVQLSWDNSSVPGKDFGAKVLQPAAPAEDGTGEVTPPAPGESPKE